VGRGKLSKYLSWRLKATQALETMENEKRSLGKTSIEQMAMGGDKTMRGRGDLGETG